MARYKKDGREFPSVTEIISDCTDKSGALCQWAANMCVEWIRENCQTQRSVPVGPMPEDQVYKWYCVYDKDLNQSRFAYKDVSKKALDVGSEVHNAIESYLKLTLQKNKFIEPDYISSTLSGQAANAFGAFLQWMDEHEIKPIALEQKVYGDYWAGTLDFVGWFDGKIYVTDWKTSAGYYPEMRYQAAAYRWAWNEQSFRDALRIDNGLDKSDFVAQGCGVLRIDKKSGEPEWKDTSKSYEKDLATFNAMVDLYMLRRPRIAKKAGYKCDI